MLKKIQSLIGFVPIFALMMHSCLKDEGNYDYREPGNFYIDTTGIQNSFTMKQFGTFELTPELIYDGDKSALEYKWELYKSENTYIGSSNYGTGFSHDYTRDDYPDYTLAETEQLSEKISVSPGVYYLVFTATEPETGLKAMADYRLTVEGNIGSGLAVLYKNEEGTDIDVVYSPLFNGNLTESVYNRGTYSKANPERPFAGEPQELIATVYANYEFYYLYLTSTEDAVRLSTVDMCVTHEFEDIFAGKVPSKKELLGITYQGNNHFLTSNGIAYKCVGGSLNLTQLGMTNDEYYAVASNWTYGVNGLYYDALKRRFIFSSMWGANIDPVVNAAEHFDFGNVGKDLIYWSSGYYNGEGQVNYCFFKNPEEDGKRYMYVFLANNRYASSFVSKCAMEITACPDIAQAKHFAIGERGPVVFYATDAHVYRMTYNVNEASSSAEGVWTPETGEETITRVKLFKNDGLNLPNSAKDKYLLVSTHNTSTGEGKIYVIQSDIVSGVLNPEPVAIYEFKGRIADFDFIAQ